VDETATPRGWFVVAPLARPSTELAVEDPKKVDEVAVSRATLRNLLLPVSERSRAVPSNPARAICWGEENWASVPVASKNPGVEDPARVLTSDDASATTRILAPLESETYKKAAFELTAQPRGEKNVARVPIPSKEDDAPLPARVEVVPVEGPDVNVIRILLFVVSAVYTRLGKPPVGAMGEAHKPSG